MTRVAVVGHVEWVQFLRVDHLPVAGEIQTARRESVHAGGGAVVAAGALAEHGAQVDFYSDTNCGTKTVTLDATSAQGAGSGSAVTFTTPVPPEAPVAEPATAWRKAMNGMPWLRR